MTLSLVTAGESHGPALVAIVGGLPAGLELDKRLIDEDLRRRQEGYGRSPRQRIETDEVEVLAGLTRPLRALSFEYLPPAHDAALTALDLVERLGAAAGAYEYNYSPIETMRFAGDGWLDAAGLVQLLERYRPLGRSGDVYARLSRPDKAGTAAG